MVDWCSSSFENAFNEDIESSPTLEHSKKF